MGLVDSFKDSIRDLGGSFLSDKNPAAACGSHIGKRRKNNEDNFYFDGSYMESDNSGTPEILIIEPVEFKRILLSGGFLAVFDGMGGGEYGELASFAAAAEAEKFFERIDRVDPHDVTISLKAFCDEANNNVFETGYNLGTDNMGTTLAGLYFFDNRVWVCNLGDSRCFLHREGRTSQISEDHTDEEEMRENGITGRKPYLTQYLGINPEEMQLEPYVKSYYIHEGDRFLICSDGLTDMVSLKEINRILEGSRSPREAVKELIEEALEEGGRDNITVIVCCC